MIFPAHYPVKNKQRKFEDLSLFFVTDLIAKTLFEKINQKIVSLGRLMFLIFKSKV
jgi:hypothetical protein